MDPTNKSGLLGFDMPNTAGIFPMTIIRGEDVAEFRFDEQSGRSDNVCWLMGDETRGAWAAPGFPASTVARGISTGAERAQSCVNMALPDGICASYEETNVAEPRIASEAVTRIAMP